MIPINSLILEKTSRCRLRTVLLYIFILLFICQTGCIAPVARPGHPRLPVLYGILVDDSPSGFSQYRIATVEEWRQVQLIRRGVGLDVTPNMTLETGDTLRTGSGVAAAIRFPNGSQLFVRSHSRIRIGSVFAFVGELFVRVKGGFQVDTEFVTAGAEGTEWALRVSPNGDTRCIVLEGRTKMVSTDQRWKPILLQANEQMITIGAEYKEVSLAPPQDVRQIIRWVGQIDRVASEQPQSGDDVSRELPFYFHFNLKPYPDKKRDVPDSRSHNRQSYPKPYID